MFQIHISGFCKRFLLEPEKFTEAEGKIIQELNKTSDFAKCLDICLRIIEEFKKNLVPNYLNFYKKSLEKEWAFF